MNLLGHTVSRVRERETRHKGESIDGFMKRTWKMALAEHESNRTVLTRVKARQELYDRIRERERELSNQLVKGNKQ